jgi:hypothetical protein
MTTWSNRSSSEVTIAKLIPGDLVEVRSEAEILATLDEQGTLDKLPFMPEMLKFCGQRFRIARHALKTCVDDQDMRSLDRTFLLEEVRCDGGNHNSCGRACLIFWKEAWLKPAGSVFQNVLPASKVSRSDLVSLALRNGQFFCQSSEILNASRPLPWYQVKQYLWEVKYNRISARNFLRSLSIAVYNKLAHHGRFRSWGMITGEANGHTPSPSPLNLKPGDLVRVKSLIDIRSTLDSEGKNRSLLFAPAMKEFCGQVMRVRDRVENIVLEGTSRQRTLKDTVLLEGATCDGLCHRMCPRQSFLFWRECWLERV